MKRTEITMEGSTSQVAILNGRGKSAHITAHLPPVTVTDVATDNCVHLDSWGMLATVPIIEYRGVYGYGMAGVLLDIPTYKPNGEWAPEKRRAFLMEADDAIRFARMLLQSAQEAKVTFKRERQKAIRDQAEKVTADMQEAYATTRHCAALGCHRDRVFYDRDGVGYCKRHAEEFGIRPHGKIT